jgi:hypothetical protein
VVRSLQDSFDRYDGIGRPCVDRVPRAVNLGRHVADVPSCWDVKHTAEGESVTDPDLDAMPVTVKVTLPGHAVSPASVTTSVAEKKHAPVPSDEHVWIWSDGASEVRMSTVVPRVVSLSPKVRTHLESIDAAARSLR